MGRSTKPKREGHTFTHRPRYIIWKERMKYDPDTSNPSEIPLVTSWGIMDKTKPDTWLPKNVHMVDGLVYRCEQTFTTEHNANLSIKRLRLHCAIIRSPEESIGRKYYPTSRER